MSELVEHTEGVHQVLLAEEHTGLGIELTADDVLVDDVVTTDLDLVDGGLWPFGDADVQRDGVPLDIRLHGVYTSEDVAIIVVEVAYSILIYGETVL